MKFPVVLVPKEVFLYCDGVPEDLLIEGAFPFRIIKNEPIAETGDVEVRSLFETTATVHIKQYTSVQVIFSTDENFITRIFDAVSSGQTTQRMGMFNTVN